MIKARKREKYPKIADIQHLLSSKTFPHEQIDPNQV
jgi:hypothetical protein